MMINMTNTGKKTGRSISVLVILLSIFLVIPYLTGCSSTRRHHVLNFFFDGVPGPNEDLAFNPASDTLIVADSSDIAGIQNPEVQLLVYHVPAKEKQCDACHDHNTMGKLTMPQPEVCYQCHDDFSGIFQSLHGPVAGGYCTACHDPHMSAAAKLLIRTGQSLCLHCHQQDQVLSNEVHKEIDNAECTTCHNPHGGDDRYMLR